MTDALTLDEYAALAEVMTLRKGSRPSACIARNTKRLAGMKYIRLDKSGHPALTELGRQTLFIKQCVDGMRAVSQDPGVLLDAGVVSFLERKGHVTRHVETGLLMLTPRGRETLNDIDGAEA